jgi:hypothetical protein
MARNPCQNLSSSPAAAGRQARRLDACRPAAIGDGDADIARTDLSFAGQGRKNGIINPGVQKLLPFVQFLPAPDGGRVDVTVHELPNPLAGSRRCGHWMDLVHDPFIADDQARADRDWDWRWRIPLLTFGGGLARRPRLFQLCRADNDFPLAMVSLLENERWIGDHARSAVFVWYLAGAPSWAVASHGAPKLLSAAALDIAISVSLNGPAMAPCRPERWGETDQLVCAPRSGEGSAQYDTPRPAYFRAYQ